MVEFNQNLPQDDGITHINIFSKGRTELGRLLSNFAETPFIHPYFGPFNSMEGFWYYVRAVKPDDKLRMLVGPEAKFYGKKLESRFLKNFQTIIMDAIYHKVVQNPKIKNLMIESTLPFDHYYTFGSHNSIKQVRLAQFTWLIEGFEDIRKRLKNNEPYRPLDYQKLLEN